MPAQLKKKSWDMRCEVKDIRDEILDTGCSMLDGINLPPLQGIFGVHKIMVVNNPVMLYIT